MTDSGQTDDVHGFGIAWDPEWVGNNRLVVRGYQARSGHPIVARWDLEALIATVDDALERADWGDIDREAARAALRHLYEGDLKP